MKILVTGAAGFIGFHLCKRLLEEKFEIIGLDNLNNYYDIKLKEARLEELFFKAKKLEKDFIFIKESLENKKALEKLFKDNNPEIVINLAAQAGVRYSLENPQAYILSLIHI